MKTGGPRAGGLRTMFRALSHMATMIGLVTLAVAWSGITLYLAGQREATTEAAEQNAANLARAFEEQIARSIKSVDQALLFVRTQFEREPETFDLQTWGQNDYYLRDLAVQLAVINPDGMMRASNVGASTTPIDLSDREHFRFHVGRSTDDLFISKPVLGRVTEKWTIQLTRKLRKPDGSFGGVLVGSIDPNYLSQFYQSIDVGQSGGITLIGTDGVIRARGSQNADVLGRKITNKRLLELASQHPSGTYMGDGAVDGVQRLVSYRKVKDFPLIVTVGFDPTEIFERYEDSKTKVLRAGGAFTAFVFLAIGWATRQKIRLDATSAALVEKSETLGLTLSNMSQGVVVVDSAQDVVIVNEQALAILDLSGRGHEVPFAFASIRALGYNERAEQDLGNDGLPISTVGSEWLMPSGKIVEVRQAQLPSGGNIITLSDVTRRRQYQKNLEEALERAETASRARTSFLANMSHEMRTPLNGVISMTDLLAETTLDGDQRHYVDIAKSSAEHLLQLIDDILDVSKLEADQVQFETIPFDIHAVITDALEITAPKAHEKSLAVGAFVAPDIPRQLIGDPGRIRQILINLIGNSIKFTSKGYVHLNVDRLTCKGEEVELEMLVEDTGIGISADKISTLFKDFSQVDSSISRRYGGTGLGLSICRKLAARMGGSITVESELGIGTQFRVRLSLLAAGDSRDTIARLAGVQVAILSSSEHFSMLVHRQILAEGGVAEAFTSLKAARAWLEARLGSDHRPILLVDLDAVDDYAQISFNSMDPFETVPVSANSAASFAGAAMHRLLHKPLLVDPLVRQLLAASARRGDLTRDPQPAPEPDQPMRLPLRILVAEDHLTNQFAIRRILENMGATVTVAGNGLEAVMAVQRGAFDLVLMDMMMPEMDGLSATRAIRALPGQVSNIPVVALTANAFKEDQAAGLAAGMNGYTTKPTTRRKLYTAVMEVLGRAVEAKQPGTTGDLDLDPTVFGTFAEEMGADTDFAVEQFIGDVEQRFAKMTAAHHRTAVVERETHAIKSAAGLLGLQQLARLAADIEVRCKEDLDAPVETAVMHMREAFDAARAALQRAA